MHIRAAGKSVFIFGYFLNYQPVTEITSETIVRILVENSDRKRVLCSGVHSPDVIHKIFPDYNFTPSMALCSIQRTKTRNSWNPTGAAGKIRLLI
jgi:hypothetical protein